MNGKFYAMRVPGSFQLYCITVRTLQAESSKHFFKCNQFHRFSTKLHFTHALIKCNQVLYIFDRFHFEIILFILTFWNLNVIPVAPCVLPTLWMNYNRFENMTVVITLFRFFTYVQVLTLIVLMWRIG